MGAEVPSFFYGLADKPSAAQVDRSEYTAGLQVKTFGRKRRLCSSETGADTGLTARGRENVALSASEEASSSGQGQEAAKSPAKPPFCKKITTPTARRPLVQMHLDFGQANFVCTTCKVCGMVYAKGQEKDEKLHAAFHSSTVQGISFQGWQQERVVKTHPNGSRIIAIHPQDAQSRLKKVAEICKLVEAQLGMADGWLSRGTCKVFLMISPLKRVTGVLVAENIKSAFVAFPAAAPNSDKHPDDFKSRPGQPVLASSPQNLQQGDNSNSTNDRGIKMAVPCTEGKPELGNNSQGAALATQGVDNRVAGPSGAVLAVDKSQPQPAEVGVRGIWVSLEARRTGIATHLLDAARAHSVEGVHVAKESLAFSQPTEDGTQLARRYIGSSFLVWHYWLVPMFDDVLWRLIYKWRVLSYRHHWLRLVIPAALTLDMVHNVYIVAAEWRQRVKDWKEEDAKNMTDAVEATLRRVASHCAQKDEDLWPDAILQHLQLLAVPAVPLAQSSTPTAAHDVAEPDILSWLVSHSHHGSLSEQPEGTTTITPSDVAPLPEPPQAVARKRWPWQQQLERAALLLQSSKAFTESQISRLRLLTAQGPKDEAIRGPEISGRDASMAARDGWQPLEATAIQSPLASGAAMEEQMPAGKSARQKRPGWTDMLSGGLDASIDSARKALHEWCPMPVMDFRRRSALRFRVKFHGVCWPTVQQRSLELDLSNL